MRAHHRRKPPQGLLTVSDVQQVRVERARVNHETYKKLYGVVHDRIKRRAEVNATHLTYAVPPFVPGRPVYNVTHAARYITDKLRRGGFSVWASDDGATLFVDWAPKPKRLHLAAAAAPPPQPPARSRAPLNRDAIASRLEALKRLI